MDDNIMTALHERNGSLNIWWFPREFSQSRFGEYQHSGTNSCTLITLLLADMICKNPGRGFDHEIDQLPQHVVEMFGAAINEGNGVYNRTFPRANPNSASENLNLNIPDALSALERQPNLRFQLQEWFFTHLQDDPATDLYMRHIAFRLSQIFQLGVALFQEARKHEPPNFLYAALIADSRTVMFVFEFPAGTISFFDSHQHGRDAGAVIAQCKIDDLLELVQWYVNMLSSVYQSRPNLFEVSFLTLNTLHLAQPQHADELLLT